MNVVCYGGFRASSLLFRPRPGSASPGAADRLGSASPGAWALAVACHAVFELAPDVSPLIAKPLPLEPAQGDDDRAFVEPWAPPVPFKRHAEVIVVGHAHAPPGSKVTSLVARLGVGDFEKLIHVHGDTYFTREGALTAPLPFERMPLRWERAAGVPNEDNPVGVAMGKAAIADAQGRVALPNLRPMGTSIRTRNEVVAPVGFGPLRPTWPLRVERLHQHAAFWDWERWAEAPLPADFDAAFFNVAPPDQALSAIAPEERLFLDHLHPRFPRLVTALSAVAPCVVASLGGVERDIPVTADTLVIDSDRGLAFVVWRGQTPLPHPAQEGVIFVSAARIAASAAGTMEGARVVGGASLPFQRSSAAERPRASSPMIGAETITGASPSHKPVLPFQPELREEIHGEIREEDSEPPTVRGGAPAGVDAESKAQKPPPIAPAPRPSKPLSIERCASIAAKIAAPGADRSALLAAEEVTPEAWEREHARWLGEIQDELDRGLQRLVDLAREQQRIFEKHLVDLETAQLVDLVFEEHRRLLVAYDEAYVAEIEAQRGPLSAGDFARLSRAADRGEAGPVLVELRLPEGSQNRLRRVFRARMAGDPRLAAEVRAALGAVKA